ncbi:hypothetical protein G5714_006477 [Onychostoma macrolepis]|uniref:PLA2c domain-containing protein n=1 Tax=Onychostoma macrolepis TaxID=369639 RepID=A0A7J6D430_9TELE|nr:hypothetical protein G5714_006477 [Onychostoma macrolepis]
MVGLLGSLVQLEKAGLLDCILYLSGVSGSTWCMASLYKEPDWSTKLETVKDKIIERISGPGVSWEDALAKLKKYYYGKDFFSLTDVWAVMTVTSRVKEIDEHTLTEQRNKNNKDPFPIYTVVDKQCKQCSDGGLHAGADLTNKRDQWFEINPYEAGYSLTGAFVDTSSFGSQFHKGSKKKHQDEFDMLYLQALCGSALGDGKQNKEEILKQMQEQPEREYEEVNKEMESDSFHCGFASDDVPISPPVDECYQVLMDLVDMNLTVLKGKDTSHLDESIRKNLNDLSGGTNHSICSMKKEVETTDRVEKPDIMSFTMDVCNNLKGRIKFWLFEAWIAMLECVTQWIWGRKYNFLHNMTDGAVPPALLESETRDYIDAGLSNNSPYFSVLRKERDIDLIISLDFSAGDPFMKLQERSRWSKYVSLSTTGEAHPSDAVSSELPSNATTASGQSNLDLSVRLPARLNHPMHGTVRFKPLLNGSEQEFVASRRNTVLQTLKKLQIQCSRDEVPNIALLGSGGGQRAMVGLLGSLVQLDKAGLLDCILYLSGVSGSTWCMASLYKEPDWSTKLETVKDKIIERISGPGVSWGDKLAKLKKYYNGKDFFSLTDIWAVMIVTSFVKEIDEHTLTEQRNKNNKDPFPIYTVVDKQSKESNDGDQWFEINPYEAGYSLTGAFVDTSSFSSQFHKGSKKKHQGEFDMLYLQALCGSALGDEQQIKEEILEKIQEQPQKEHEEVKKEMESVSVHGGFASDDVPISPPVDGCYQVLMDLVDMNLTVLKGEDTSHLDESIRRNLNDLSGGTNHSIGSTEKLETADIMNLTMDVCNNLRGRIKFWLFDAWIGMFECVTQWIWGRKYNFLHNMTDGAVPPALLESETRDYIDAGLSNNSPYFSVLRKERDIDLIISLDFSAGDPFMSA